MLTSINFDIPILFIVFNRLDTTKHVFEVVKKVAPKRLYIASDGHRCNHENEKEKVEAVREYILKSINWDCDVNTLFREENLGCGKAVSGAITWFFENEEMGIILEDDCLPSDSFFSYCKELLTYYKDNTHIFHIAGYNPLTKTKIPSSYCFSRIPQIWGWASWRRAWSTYSFDIKDLCNFIKKEKINKIFTKRADRYHWIEIFKSIEKHEVDTWDYQWVYTVLNNDGICIDPALNLITNIGFGHNATHTHKSSFNFGNQQRFEIDVLLHPCKVKIKNNYINKINEIDCGINTLFYYIIMVKKMIKKNMFLYNFFKKCREKLKRLIR